MSDIGVKNIIGSISPLPKFIKNDSFDLLNVISVNPDLSLYDMSILLPVLVISATMTFLILQPIISCHTEPTVIFLSFILSTSMIVKKKINGGTNVPPMLLNVYHVKPKSDRLILHFGSPSFQKTIPSILFFSRKSLIPSKVRGTSISSTPCLTSLS